MSYFNGQKYFLKVHFPLKPYCAKYVFPIDPPALHKLSNPHLFRITRARFQLLPLSLDHPCRLIYLPLLHSPRLHTRHNRTIHRVLSLLAQHLMQLGTQRHRRQRSRSIFLNLHKKKCIRFIIMFLTILKRFI